ncbi:MAG: 50S ribosomal protein L32e [Nanoarchaeota archaeon]|nr:50S ribosomal protein L32e [Nanoarchaeota archaeon]
MRLLNLRRKLKRKKPTFRRQNAGIFLRIGEKWRKPRGVSSKLRRHKHKRGKLPNPGYSSPVAVRFLHPCGLAEVSVSNINDLVAIDNKIQCARIAAKVGNKKRIDIQKKAEELKIKVLNVRKIELKKKVKKVMKEEVKVEKKNEAVK